MKKLMITIICMLFSTQSFAQSMFDGMTKEQLGEYEIYVVKRTSASRSTLVGKMSRAKYKVVLIEESSGVPEHVQAAIDSIRLQFGKVTKQAQVVDAYQNGYNTLIVHAGVGRSGLDKSYSSGQYEITEHETAVAGVTGCRSVENKGLCASAFTNSTFLLGLKLDFK